MVTVCLLTYNGEKYITEQINSILIQLSEFDEVIVSDDGSTDKTLDIIAKLGDQRIKIFRHSKPNQNAYKGVFKNVCYISSNCANALSHATGDLIFLSDQDDVWMPNKIKLVTEKLKECDLVIHNCAVVDGNLKLITPSYFDIAPVRLSFIGLLRKSSFMGCCMAFNKKILKCALPFPDMLVEHDAWIGICAIKNGIIKTIDEPLVYYRRHGSNISPCSERSANSLYIKFKRRIFLIKAYFYDRSKYSNI